LSSITSVISNFLIFTNVEIPPYAAHFIFELYQDQESGKYYARVLYNDNQVQFPNCPSADKCELQSFLEGLKPAIVEDWNTECELMKEDHPIQLEISNIPNIWVTISTIVVFGAGVLFGITFSLLCPIQKTKAH
jgi:hypothetical protein